VAAVVGGAFTGESVLARSLRQPLMPRSISRLPAALLERFAGNAEAN